ncbi:hypothetical protein PPERSA_05385 [Pseudocohnilembus persalinus]|uniref:Uncharacterized protein n=1 Tax=Pseudocohnilembus persalinus TaxID=266149 RepID=A0A0V0R8I2_PSEPJ|nr:hypothetical protein PPERSA_05385 [Pseudocohnilembus persalinus]|eukprot:KRX10565.1 hypothetical protein PPERSA_05385 [Pseudocohnilembus persalinus]
MKDLNQKTQTKKLQTNCQQKVYQERYGHKKNFLKNFIKGYLRYLQAQQESIEKFLCKEKQSEIKFDIKQFLLKNRPQNHKIYNIVQFANLFSTVHREKCYQSINTTKKQKKSATNKQCSFKPVQQLQIHQNLDSYNYQFHQSKSHLQFTDIDISTCVSSNNNQNINNNQLDTFNQNGKNYHYYQNNKQQKVDQQNYKNISEIIIQGPTDANYNNIKEIQASKIQQTQKKNKKKKNVNQSIIQLPYLKQQVEYKEIINQNQNQQHKDNYQQDIEKKILRVFAFKFIRDGMYAYFIKNPRIVKAMDQFKLKNYLVQKLTQIE